VDLRLFVTPESPETLLESPPFDPEVLISRIARAGRRQRTRAKGRFVANAALGPRDLEEVCGLSPSGRRLVAEAGRAHDWSSRALHSLLRVGRTLADLDDAETVGESHLEEAVGLRKPRGEEYWER
jgi:magnesium chelatase family protein